MKTPEGIWQLRAGGLEDELKRTKARIGELEKELQLTRVRSNRWAQVSKEYEIKLDLAKYALICIEKPEAWPHDPRTIAHDVLRQLREE